MHCRKTSEQKLTNIPRKKIKLVMDFYERDDNSRATAGKKETIKRKQIKKQKRYLNDNMKILHKKFCSENPEINMCYSSFCALRPFWVLIPKASDRDTCLCAKHENIQLMVTALHKAKVVNSPRPDVMLKQLVCSMDSKLCMYGECPDCKQRELAGLDKDVGDQVVTYSQWQTVAESITVDEKQIKITKTKKPEKQSDCFDLYSKVQMEMKQRFGKHVYNIYHQYRALGEQRKQLCEDEALVQIDFSENFSCKYDREVQSAHFGGSKGQVSLHTGILYLGPGPTPRVVGFCSISDNTDHTPAGIWAHLKPVLHKHCPPAKVKKTSFRQ